MVFWKKKNKNTEEAQSCFNKSVQLYKDKKYDEALIEINKAISNNPDNYSYYNYKGIQLEAIKKYKEAIIEYNKTLKLLGYEPGQETMQKVSANTYTFGPEQSEIADVVFNKAVSLENLGKIKDAIDIYRSIMQIDPSRLDAPMRACQLYYNSGEYKEASELIGGLFTYDLEEIKQNCEIGNCETSDLINCLETVIKSCQKINETEDLDTYIDRLLELDPENQLARSVKK